jgi:hypothetical protein
LPESEGITAQELADRVEQRIGFDERAVQIDAQWARQVGLLGRNGILRQNILMEPTTPAGPRETNSSKSGATRRLIKVERGCR